MPLSEELLQPISQASPSGKDLRYIIYDKVREARREDDELNRGAWITERKKADYPLALRLCCEALEKDTKDLQLAAWATESSLTLDSLPGFHRGLDFLARLLDGFWDSLYPIIEDDDLEPRAAILYWLSGRTAQLLLRIPLTDGGFTWLQYRESRAVGYEADCADDDAKRERFQQAIDEGKLSADAFEHAFVATKKAFYEDKLNEADLCLRSLEQLDATCSARFQQDGPSFNGVKERLEELRQALRILLNKKLEQEPSAETPAAETEFVLEEVEPSATLQRETVRVPVPVKRQSASAEPESVEDAIKCILDGAKYLRTQEPYRPLAYLVTRAVRWGELRETSGELNPDQLEPPPTQIRKRLKMLAQNAEWDDLLDDAEAAMSLPCGRGWLDLQRYIVKACKELGDSYAPIAAAITSELKALLEDYPQLLEASLCDATPAANPETQVWAANFMARTGPSASSFSRFRKAEVESEPCVEARETTDAFESATQAAASGRTQEAIEILEREIAREASGRRRFRRRLQLAEICMNSGHKAVALPILEGLAQEIERRDLEAWEDPDLLINVLRLLFLCMEKQKNRAEEREKVYARICRLAPTQALELSK